MYERSLINTHRALNPVTEECIFLAQYTQNFIPFGHMLLIQLDDLQISIREKL